MPNTSAVRLNGADASSFQSNTAAPPQSITMRCFVKISTDTNTWACFLALTAADGSSYGHELITNSDGTTLCYFGGTTFLQGLNAVVGQWYYVGVTILGTETHMIQRPVGARGYSRYRGTAAFNDVLASTQYIGREQDSSESLNGCVAGCVVWHGQRSLNFLESESHALKARDRSGLFAEWACDDEGFVSGPGNRRMVSNGGTITRENGPPGIPLYPANRSYHPLIAGMSSGKSWATTAADRTRRDTLTRM